MYIYSLLSNKGSKPLRFYKKSWRSFIIRLNLKSFYEIITTGYGVNAGPLAQIKANVFD